MPDKVINIADREKHEDLTEYDKAQDHRTLGEIKDDFNEQTKTMVGNIDAIFLGPPENRKGPELCYKVRKAILQQILEYCGIDFSNLANTSHELSAKRWDKTMETQDIEVRHHNKFKDDYAYLNGMYVFKRKELVGFVSDNLLVTPGLIAIPGHRNGWYIYTNWDFRSHKGNRIIVPGKASLN